jgi:two-component system cell cycle response regulator
LSSLPLKKPVLWFPFSILFSVFLLARAVRKKDAIDHSAFLISLSLIIGSLGLKHHWIIFLYVPLTTASGIFYAPEVFLPVWGAAVLVEVKGLITGDKALLFLLLASFLSGGIAWLGIKRLRERVADLGHKISSLGEDAAVLSTGDMELKEAAREELAQALQLAREALGADSVSVFKPDGMVLVLKDSTAGDVRAAGEGLLWMAFKKGQTIIMNNANERDESLGYERDAGISSFMAAPLYDGDKVVGVITADSTRSEAFSGRDSLTFNSLGPLIAGMMKRQRVYIETERKLREYEVLKEESMNLLRSPDLKEIAWSSIKALARIAPVGTALFVKKNDEYELIAASGIREPGKKRFASLKGSLLENAVQGMLPVYLSDLKGYHLPALPFGAGGVKSLLALPLISESKVLGVLALVSERTKPFTMHQIELLKLFSEQVSVTLSRAFLHEDIKHMATTDGLTGLYNHRHFQERLSQEFRRLSRYPRPLSLLILDIDFFKKVNDSYGHPAGDAVLKNVALILKKIVRETDIPARYGGEEFAALLTDTDKRGAEQVADRLRKNIMESLFRVDSKGIHITVSIGVATYPSDAKTKESLIELADRALYRAKEEGRNRVVLA